jgi:hypothetical protein
VAVTPIITAPASRPRRGAGAPSPTRRP